MKKLKTVVMAACLVAVMLIKAQNNPMREYDAATVTGDEIVKLHASKKEGLSSAKIKKLQADVAGRTLTFTNGKLSSVSKSSLDNRLRVLVRFDAPNAGFMSPSLTVSGLIGDKAMEQLAQALDEGAKIKSLSGTASRREGPFGLLLEDVKIVPGE